MVNGNGLKTDLKPSSDIINEEINNKAFSQVIVEEVKSEYSQQVS